VPKTIEFAGIVSFFAWIKIERCRNDAVPQAGGLGTIAEEMTQVSAAAIA